MFHTQRYPAVFLVVADNLDVDILADLQDIGGVIDPFPGNIRDVQKPVNAPKIDLQLNATQGDNLGGVKGRDTSASALLVVNWNLYRGGADMARVREFTHRHQQAKESRDQTARALEDDVRQTWARMVSSGERASQFSAQAAANAEVVRAYKDQFSLDRRTLLDVLDAQNELFVSRTNTINAEFLEMFSIFRLVAVKGQLLPTLGVAYPRESDQISVNIEQVDR